MIKMCVFPVDESDLSEKKAKFAGDVGNIKQNLPSLEKRLSIEICVKKGSTSRSHQKLLTVVLCCVHCRPASVRAMKNPPRRCLLNKEVKSSQAMHPVCRARYTVGLLQHAP